MRKHRMIALAMVGALAFVSPGVLAGCTPGSAVEDTRMVVGEQAEGAIELAAVNGLGADAASIALGSAEGEQWSNNLLAEGDVLAADQEVRLFVPGEYASGCDMLLVTSDGTSYEFIDVPVQNVTKMTFMQGDDVAYVDYETEEGTTGSTKDAALELKAKKEAEEQAKKEAEEKAKKEAEEKAKQEAEEQARKEAEEEAARQAEEEAARQAEEEAAAQEEYYEETYYEEPSYEETYYEEPSYDDYSYEESYQSEDQCLDDVVFR